MIKFKAEVEDDSEIRRQNRWNDLVHTAMEAINTRDSLLLRSPAEIRTKIWGYVLGHKHIYPDYPQPLRGNIARWPRLVCDCDGARNEIAHSRTKSCFSAPLHLELLSTCRRTYLEAFPVLWSTNTFCFEESYAMFLTFQSLASHQMSMIRNVRLDINHFIRGGEWEINLENSKLTSLKNLRKLDLSANTFTTYTFLPTTPRRITFRNPHLVNSVVKFSARRPSFAVVSVRRCHIYHTSDAKEVMENARIEECLERMQEMLGEEQGAANGD